MKKFYIIIINSVVSDSGTVGLTHLPLLWYTVYYFLEALNVLLIMINYPNIGIGNCDQIKI